MLQKYAVFASHVEVNWDKKTFSSLCFVCLHACVFIIINQFFFSFLEDYKAETKYSPQKTFLSPKMNNQNGVKMIQMSKLINSAVYDSGWNSNITIQWRSKND